MCLNHGVQVTQCGGMLRIRQVKSCRLGPTQLRCCLCFHSRTRWTQLYVWKMAAGTETKFGFLQGLHASLQCLLASPAVLSSPTCIYMHLASPCTLNQLCRRGQPQAQGLCTFVAQHTRYEECRVAGNSYRNQTLAPSGVRLDTVPV